MKISEVEIGHKFDHGIKGECEVIKDQIGNISKPLLCDVTLKFILEDVNLRMEILKLRDDCTLNTARMHEILLIEVYLQNMLLANIT